MCVWGGTGPGVWGVGWRGNWPKRLSSGEGNYDVRKGWRKLAKGPGVLVGVCQGPAGDDYDDADVGVVV